MKKAYTMMALAQALDGELIGDGNVMIDRVAHPADVRGARDLAFATDKKLLALVTASVARAAVIAADAEMEPGILDACILVKRPRLAMAKLNALFEEPVTVPVGIPPTAVIAAGAQLDEPVAIGPHVYIGEGAVIGRGVVLHPQVYIGPEAVIGRNTVIHAGARIGARVEIGDNALIHFNAAVGADGFSFVTPEIGSVEAAKATGAVNAANHTLIRIASLGTVVIGNDVEIGANTTIDRGTIAATRIGNGTKIDNQVQVGHNVTIGENCLICGRVGIAGSAVVGNRVVLGGAVGIADHVTIGDDAVAMAMSGIAGNVPAKTIVAGIPARPREQTIEAHFNLGRLKSLIKKVESLTARLDKLEPDGKSR